MQQFCKKAVIFVLLIGLTLQQFLLFPAALFAQEPPLTEDNAQEPSTTEETVPQAADPETTEPEAPPEDQTQPEIPKEETEPQTTPEQPEPPAEPSEPEEPTEPQTTPEEAAEEPEPETEEQLPPEEPAPVEPAPPQEPAQSLVEDLSSIGTKEGFGEEGEAQTTLVPQEDKNITVVAKIEENEIARANRDGLAILKGDIETRPEEVLFFQEEGVKKQIIELSELVKKESESIVTQGGDGIVLNEVAKREQGGAAVAVNVEDIVIQKTGDGFLQKLADTIFGGGKDDEREERVRIEVTNEGVVRMIDAENIEGDEKIEIEYSYGAYTKPFEVSFVPISLSAAFSVDSLSAGELEQAITNLEQPEPPPATPVEEITSEEDAPEETIPAPPVVENTEETETPEAIPSEPPSSSPPTEEPPATPTIIEEPEEPEAPSAPIEPLGTESPPIEETPGAVEETTIPVTLSEEGAVQGARVQNLDADAESGIINRVKKFFQSFLSGAMPARAQESSQTVQAFQVKLKAATVKGEQTFQILPNGLVYLYHGTSIEAISRPRFQYLQTGNWTDFVISGASQGTQTEGDRATHLIQFATAEGDIITLKYDFGLEQNEIFKKQSWTISGDKTARVLWETLFRAGTPAQKELASTLSASPPSEGGAGGGSRTRLYGDIVVDTSDYAGNVEIEEDAENNIVRVYFEKDGKQAPFTIDPSFSVVTGDQFIEVATPDFQSPGSQMGWKIRFNRLMGGGIDQYFHNSVNNGETNIASSTKPLFDIGYTNTVSKLLSQTQAYSMEVIERGATRLRVRSRVNLGNDQLTIIYTVYLAGQIYIDVENVIRDGSISSQQNVFQLNQSYAGYQSGFGLQDASTRAIAIDSTQIDTALIPSSAIDAAEMGQNFSEVEDYIQTALGAGVQQMYANGNTASNQFLLSLAFVPGSSEDPGTTLSSLASDYQTPDSLTPFTLGTFQGYASKEGAYEMTANGNKVEFAMNGATHTRYNPIFKIANWNIPVLALIFAKLDNGEIKQDLDYIVTFQNGDPNTRTLIFQYIGDVSDVRTFYIDPTCTSTGAGNWSTVGIWDCGVVPDGDDTAVVRHAVTVNQDVTILGITIDTGGKLDFDTTARTVTVNENAGAATITVGAASGGSGELECRAPTTGVHTIKLNSTTADAAVGIVVESTGILDIQGTSSADQDCVITNGAVTLDGTLDGYIHLKDGSETIIKNADISYMGANTNPKYGVYSVSVDSNVANEGFILEGSTIHDSYATVRLSNATYNIVRNNVIYNAGDEGIYSINGGGNHIIVNNDVYNSGGEGIRVDNDDNTILGNSLHNNRSFGNLVVSTNADRNYVYNNTLNASIGDENLWIGGGAGTNGGNVIKNNLITNTPAGRIGIDDDGTGTVLSNNYYYNNGTGGTVHCTAPGGAACSGDSPATGSGTPNSTQGTNPNYVSTDPTNADFLYVSVDSAALGPGLNIFAGTAPGTVNVGGRLDYVKNTTDNEEFNWLQQAHDDASLGAGDTVTAYAVNVVSDTISGGITQAGLVASTYYYVKFNVAEATVVADNDHEGFYAYFTSGLNRGRYYTITDSDENTTDTLTILSVESNTTFTAGDGFTIVDRVYTKDSGKADGNCSSASTNNNNLCINKNGIAASPITWNTSGTVIIDGQSIRTYGVKLYNSGQYNIIDGFIIINAANSGMQLRDADYSVFKNLFLGRNTHGGIINKDGTTTNVVFDSNVITGTNGTAYGQGIEPFGSSVYANNIFYDNNGTNTLSTAMGIGSNSLVFNNVLINNVRGIQFNGTSNIIARGNRIIRGSTGINIRQGTSADALINNTIIGLTMSGVGTENGGGTTHRALNNIVGWNGIYGIQLPADSASNFNFFYSNTTANTNGPTEGAGSIAGADPNFYFDVSAVVLAGATTNAVDLSGTQAWTHNQWVGYGLTFTGGSCPAAVLNKWFGITSNSAEYLFYAPTPASAPDTNCTGKITGFTITSTTSATTPLGQGARHDGATEPGTVNMGAELGYVLNDDESAPGSTDIKNNTLQLAHDHANVNAGDTITTYAVNEVSDTLGTTITDLGPYITVDVSEATIVTDDDYIGYYAYFTSGTNRGKYYLIIDSDENTTDTISLAPTDGTANFGTTGFTAGDGFSVVDRVYTRESGSTNANCTGATEGLCLYTSGAATAPITWTTSGTVTIDSASTRSYGIDIAGADYNVVSGFTVIGGLLDGIRLTNVNNSRYANLTVARNAGMGINDGSGNQDNVFETNTVLANTSHGLGSINQSLVSGNTVYGNSGRGIDVTGTSAVYNNNFYANADSVFVTGPDNTVRGNKILRDTQSGIVFSGATTSGTATNNLLLANTTNGIAASSYSGSNNAIRNNIITNTGTGINLTFGTGDVSNFNYFYSNTTNVLGGEGASSLPASGGAGGTDPNYSFDVSATNVTAGSVGEIDLTGTQNWTANQWVGYGLTFVDGSGVCDSNVKNKWFGITQNGSEWIAYSPTPSSASTITNCAAKITNFALPSTSGTTPLGNGANHGGTAAKVNMGSRLEYVENSDGTRNNGLQYAHDASATGAGDTLTVYGVDEVATATVKTSGGVTDNGPYLTLTLNEDVIAANDDYIGYYYYVTTGDNAAKYYLIIDSATAAGPADTISINTASDNNFASDVGKIIDRVYTTTGWTSGATTANARFTKDGSSGSPITWNAVASNTVLIDAASKTYAFYGDSDGANGLKYNNFQTSGAFTFVNVSNSANLYQGGFGFNTTSVVHDHVNWGGATDASTIFTGQYISKVIDMTQADPVYGKLVWGQTVTSGTSDIVMHTRSTDTASGSDIATKTFVGPDGTANTSYTTEAGEDIADAHNTHQYFQYRATLTTLSTDTLPELTSASVSQEVELTSSWFNTEDAATLFNDIVWTESNGSGGAIPSDSDVRIQVRTAPNNSGSPGSATSWCGPNDGAAGICTSTTYFTDATGASEALDDILIDATNDQWIQYKVLLIQTGSGKPYLNDITLQYVVNTAPTVSVTSASQGSDGVVTVAYSLSDAEEQGEDGAVVVGLYYERGVTIAEDLDISETDIDLGSATTLPTSGTILVDNEIVSYTGKSGNTLTGGARAAESSKAATHSSGAAAWVKAATVSGNTGTITAVTGTPSAKSATWTANTDIDGVYDATFSIRAVANDGNAANQVGYGTSSDFTLDTKDPATVSLVINANNATAGNATLTLAATDDSSLTMKLSNSSDLSADGSNADSGTAITFVASKSWILNPNAATEPDTVYMQITDAKGNTATANGSTPEKPTSFAIIDTSNQGIGDYRLFMSWKAMNASASPAFANYKVYRKLSSGADGTYAVVSTITDRLVNYFTDSAVSQGLSYDYFILALGSDASSSYRSTAITAIPNAAQDGNEGGGADDTTKPTIVFTESAGEGAPSNSRITITFQTYDNAGTIRDAKIDYGTVSGTFTATQGIPTATSGTSVSAPATRAITLEALAGNAVYYYRLSVRDASGNLAIDDNDGNFSVDTGAGYTFTTTADAGPIISNVQSILINSTTVKITWTTDKVASSQVLYATNSALTGQTSYPASPTDSDTNHEVQITGLTAGAAYYYKARSVDAAGNTSDSAVYSFTTADTAPPVITNVSSTSVTHNSATITFSTNEVASSSVNYGTSVAYGSAGSNTNYNTNHVFNITGLSPETVYYYKVNATDAGGNPSTSDNSGAGYTFTTLASPNTVISNVRAVYVSAIAVDVKWDTTVAAGSQVQYGTDSNLAVPTSQPGTPSDSVTSHTVSLSGLGEATRYYYRVISGANQSPIYNFLTGDTTVPTITGISSVYNDKTAVISWTTNEAATSQVEYGITDAYGSSTTLDSLLTLAHAVTLTNLTPATTYYFRVKSQDGLQNAAASAVQQFTTNAGVNAGTTTEDAAAPVITNITTLVSDVTAVVSWTTNKDATSQVEYGASASYGTSSTLETSVTKDHIVRLTDLTPSTTYHFRAKSQDSIGNLAISGDQTFTTNAGKFKYETQTTGGGGVAALVIDKRDSIPAAIVNFTIEKVGEEDATLSWRTNEPSVTLLGYGKRAINDVSGNKESIDNRVTNHTLILRELTAGTEYRAQPFAIDAGGNVTQGTIASFTTKGEKPAEAVEEEKNEEEEKEAEKKPVDIIEEEEPISEEGKVLLTEEFEKFIKKLEVYLGPPVIVGVTVSDVTDSSAVINWKTTVPAASILDYGASETYGELVRLLQFDQEHSVTLKGLREDTVYHYRIKGVTESGQLVATQDMIFRTTEIGKIVNFSVNDIQEHSIIVSWKSNVPATSEVEFGVLGKDSLERQGKDALATAHKLLITGLKEKTKYRIRVVSRDAGAQIITNDFAEFTTSIDDRPPLITELEAEGLLTRRDSVRVIVSWDTDEPGTSQVFYEVGVERGRELKQETLKDENFTTDHTVLINDFQPGTLYQIRARSLDRAGNVGISEDYTIITPKKEENIIDIIVTEFQDAFGFLKR